MKLPAIIIDKKTQIESINDENIFQDIYVPRCEAEESAQEPQADVQYYHFKLQCGRREYYIHCPLVKGENGNIALVVPSFMLPNRPYPVYVYIYAILLYCENLEMGQREVARKTKEYFDMETFDHSTLCRAMKAIERLRDEASKNTTVFKQPKQNCFPTTAEMYERKLAMLEYFKEASGGNTPVLPNPKHKQTSPPYKGAFIGLCHQIFANIYGKC